MPITSAAYFSNVPVDGLEENIDVEVVDAALGFSAQIFSAIYFSQNIGAGMATVAWINGRCFENDLGSGVDQCLGFGGTSFMVKESRFEFDPAQKTPFSPFPNIAPRRNNGCPWSIRRTVFLY